MISSNSETNILFMGLESVQCTPSDEKSRWLTIDRFAAAFCKQIGPPTKPLQDFPRNHSVSPGKPPLPRYTSAARRVNTAARLDSRARHSYRGILSLRRDVAFSRRQQALLPRTQAPHLPSGRHLPLRAEYISLRRCRPRSSAPRRESQS